LGGDHSSGDAFSSILESDASDVHRDSENRPTSRDKKGLTILAAEGTVGGLAGKSDPPEFLTGRIENVDG
jgi:hypothetical protein